MTRRDQLTEASTAGITYASCTEGRYEVLRYLLDHDHPITELVSLTPEQAEANAVSGYRSVEAIADDHDLPCTTRRRTNSTPNGTGHTSRSPTPPC